MVVLFLRLGASGDNSVDLLFEMRNIYSDLTPDIVSKFSINFFLCDLFPAMLEISQDIIISINNLYFISVVFLIYKLFYTIANL